MVSSQFLFSSYIHTKLLITPFVTLFKTVVWCRIECKVDFWCNIMRTKHNNNVSNTFFIGNKNPTIMCISWIKMKMFSVPQWKPNLGRFWSIFHGRSAWLIAYELMNLIQVWKKSFYFLFFSHRALSPLFLEYAYLLYRCFDSSLSEFSNDTLPILQNFEKLFDIKRH